MFLRGGGTATTPFFVSRLILITGGARSGKSRFAQTLAEQSPARKRIFIATAVACDKEMRARILRHRKERDSRWLTMEEPTLLPERLPIKYLAPGHLILLDCVPTFLTNLLLARHSHTHIQSRINRLLKRLRRPGVTAVLVTNEIGLGLVPDNPLGREFRDLLGMVNQQIAQAADEVYFLVAGIPQKLK